MRSFALTALYRYQVTWSPLFLLACLLQICLLHLVVYTSSSLSLSFLRSVVPHFVAHFLFSFFLFFLSFPFFLFIFFSSCLLFLVFFSHGGFAASGVRLLGSFFFFFTLLATGFRTAGTLFCAFLGAARFLCPKGKERERKEKK